MKTQHTPGPWIAGKTNGGDFAVWEAAALYNVLDHTAPGINAEANAQLMAAAPILAEALKSIMEWTDTPSEQIPIERRELLVRNAARTALARAGVLP